MDPVQPEPQGSSLVQMRDLALALAAGMLLLSMFLDWYGSQSSTFTLTSLEVNGWQASAPVAIVAALAAAFAIARLWPAPAWRRLDLVAGVIVAVAGAAAFIALERMRGNPPLTGSGYPQPLEGFDTASTTALFCVVVGTGTGVLEAAARTRFDWARLPASDGLVAVAGIVLVASTAIGWQQGVTPWLLADSGAYVVALCGTAMTCLALWRAMSGDRFPLFEGFCLAMAGIAAAAVLSARIKGIVNPTGIAEAALVAGLAVAALGLWSLRKASRQGLAAEAAALRDALRQVSGPAPDQRHRAQAPRPSRRAAYAPFLAAIVALAVAGAGMAFWKWGGLLVAGTFLLTYAIGRSWMLWIPWLIAIPVGVILPTIETSQCGPDNDLCGLAWLWLPIAVAAAAAVSIVMVAGIAARSKGGAAADQGGLRVRG